MSFSTYTLHYIITLLSKLGTLYSLLRVYKIENEFNVYKLLRQVSLEVLIYGTLAEAKDNKEITNKGSLLRILMKEKDLYIHLFTCCILLCLISQS